MNQVLDSSKVGAVGEFIKDNTKKDAENMDIYEIKKIYLCLVKTE